MYKLTDCIIVFFARLTKEIYRTTTYKYSCESSALFIEGVSATLHLNRKVTFIDDLPSLPQKSRLGEGFSSVKLYAMPSNNLHKSSSCISGTDIPLMPQY